MANRRMFSKDIVRSDTFISMSSEACLLYFQLGMEADDRGYVNNMLTISKMIGASENAIEELKKHKFILKRGDTLYLIKGWRVNNTIQPSRLVETKYTDDLRKLYFDDNFSYTTSPTDTPCLSTQNSKKKNSKKEESEDIDLEELFNHFEK